MNFRLVRSRLLSLIPVLLVVSVASFSLLQFLPGSPAAVILGTDATNSQIAQLNHQLGVDRPIVAQYLSWLSHAVEGRLGNSVINGQSVVSLIWTRLPVTLSLAVVGMVLALIGGVGLGLTAALRPGGHGDRGVSLLSAVGLSLPGFWVAILLVIPLAIWTRAFPATGYVPLGTNPFEWLRSIALGSLALSVAPGAAIARHTQRALVAAMSQDFVRAARARGLSHFQALIRHGLKNASIPVVTISSFHFATLMGGAVVVEQIFGLNGVGQLLISSVQDHDLPVVQGVVVVISLLVIAVNLGTDLIYSVLDPRVRLA